MGFGMEPRIHGFVDEGLGHSSYVVELGDGTAAVVDPPRFPDAHQQLCNRLALRLAWTIDTHSHVDYVTGSPGLARRIGATFIAPTASRLAMTYRGVGDGDRVALSPAVTLVAVATPGHTPDHHTYLLEAEGEPVALFTGGSLMVGTVGRTDLCGRSWPFPWPMRCTGPCTASTPSPTPWRCTPPTGRGRSAPPLAPANARRPWARNGRPIPCFAPLMRTTSSRSWSVASAPSPPTSRGYRRSTGSAPHRSTPSRHSPAWTPKRSPTRCRPGRFSSMPDQSPPSAPVTSRARCPTHCARCSAAGSVGSSAPTPRWCSSSTAARIAPNWSDNASTSATSTS